MSQASVATNLSDPIARAEYFSDRMKLNLSGSLMPETSTRRNLWRLLGEDVVFVKCVLSDFFWALIFFSGRAECAAVGT